MMKHSLIYYGNPLLRKKAQPIVDFDAALALFIEEMVEAMVAFKGIGLAAPQIGQLKRIFVILQMGKDEDPKKGTPKVYINPQLIDPSPELVSDMEGCLSIPKLFMEVERPQSVLIEAQDLSGNLFQETLSGLTARQIMHENDHLNGVLFIDRLAAKKRKEIESTLRSIKKKYHGR